MISVPEPLSFIDTTRLKIHYVNKQVKPTVHLSSRRLKTIDHSNDSFESILACKEEIKNIAIFKQYLRLHAYFPNHRI